LLRIFPDNGGRTDYRKTLNWGWRSHFKSCSNLLINITSIWISNWYRKSCWISQTKWISNAIQFKFQGQILSTGYEVWNLKSSRGSVRASEIWIHIEYPYARYLWKVYIIKTLARVSRGAPNRDIYLDDCINLNVSWRLQSNDQLLVLSPNDLVLGC